MTEEQRLRCARVTVAVSAVTGSLAEVLPSMQDIRVALRVALFLTDKFIEDPNSKSIDYREQVREMVMREMGFVN